MYIQRDSIMWEPLVLLELELSSWVGAGWLQYWEPGIRAEMGSPHRA